MASVGPHILTQLFAPYDSRLCDDCIELDVVWLGFKMLLLAGESQAYEMAALPFHVAKVSVIETSAHSDSVAISIETYHRYDDQVE